MMNSIYHPNYNFEFIRLHNPTKLLCLGPKTKRTCEITSWTGSSSHEEPNRPRDFLSQNVQPLQWDDPTGDDIHIFMSNID